MQYVLFHGLLGFLLNKKKFTNYEDAKEYMIAQANSICENKPGVKPAVVLEGQRLIVKSRWDGGFMDLRAMPRELFQHIREEK